MSKMRHNTSRIHESLKSREILDVKLAVFMGMYIEQSTYHDRGLHLGKERDHGIDEIERANNAQWVLVLANAADIVSDDEYYVRCASRTVHRQLQSCGHRLVLCV